MIGDLLKALAVERIKIKRTLALWLVILTPILACLIQLMIFMNMDSVPWKGVSAWTWMMRSVTPVWALFAFPMLVAVVTALFGALEHNNGGWKRLYALPTSRYAISLSKLLWAHILLLSSNLGLALGLALVGLLGRLIHPQFGFDAPLPMFDMLRMVFQFYLAAGVIISFHYWLANRSSSFTLAMGIGIGGTFIGMVQARGWYQKLFPWKYMVNTTSHLDGLREMALLLGILGGIAVAILATWDLGRREIL